MEGKVCTKCNQLKELKEFYSGKNYCKECYKKHRREYYQENKEECRRKAREHYQENKEEYKKYSKEYYQENKEKCRENNQNWLDEHSEERKDYHKKYREENKEKIKEVRKEYYQKNKEKEKVRYKNWYENNKEYRDNYLKEKHKEKRNQEIRELSDFIKDVNPLLKNVHLKKCGIIYLFKNIKTNHYYVGQTIHPIKRRYRNGIIKGWINERKEKENLKFKNELIEEDFIFKIIDYGICQYHLDKLEAYYINKYDSYNNGYNNNKGKYDTKDGIEEFNKILQENNLIFENGQLRRK